MLKLHVRSYPLRSRSVPVSLCRRHFAALLAGLLLCAGGGVASAQGLDPVGRQQTAPPAPAAAVKPQRAVPQSAGRGSVPAQPRPAAQAGDFPAPPPARPVTGPVRVPGQPARRAATGQAPPAAPQQQAAPQPARGGFFGVPPKPATASAPVQPAAAPPNRFRLPFFDFFTGNGAQQQRSERRSGWPFGETVPYQNQVKAPEQVAPEAVPQIVKPPPRPAKPAVEITSWVLVVGDSIADNLASGLGEALADRPQISVRRRIRAPSGLSETGDEGVSKMAIDAAGTDKLTFAVIELGTQDDVPLLDGDRDIPVLSDEWKQLYAKRVDAVLEAYKGRPSKVLWVGVPPMRDAALSADLVAINDIIKERVSLAGQTYVDVWEGFVDDNDRYTQTGPDLDGQEVRLRLNDGVHFTKAGSRKLAHYVEREIRRALELMEKPADVPELPVSLGETLPDAGPLIVLTAPALAPDGQLAGAATTGTPAPDEEIERVLVRGEAPTAVVGRLDDASWRPPGSPPAVVLAGEPMGPPDNPHGPVIAGVSPTPAAYATATPSEQTGPVTTTTSQSPPAPTLSQ